MLIILSLLVFIVCVLIQEVKEIRRNGSFQEKVAYADSYKELGNARYAIGDCDGAIVQYERALGVFHYVETKVVDWKRSV